MNGAPAQNVEVPASAFVPCPAAGFRAASVARRCGVCPHFQGFIEVQDHGEFTARYRVNCSHYIARRMMNVEV